ncbi:MAG: hypothetical protein ACRDT6_16095 [Micromonosporaceae bacterium]
MDREMLDFVLKRDGWKCAEFSAEADPDDPKELREVLVAAVKRDGRNEGWVDEYELEIRYANKNWLLKTFVVR